MSEAIAIAVLQDAIRDLRCRLPDLTPVERCKLRSLEMNLMVVLEQNPTDPSHKRFPDAAKI